MYVEDIKSDKSFHFYSGKSLEEKKLVHYPFKKILFRFSSRTNLEGFELVLDALMSMKDVWIGKCQFKIHI